LQPRKPDRSGGRDVTGAVRSNLCQTSGKEDSSIPIAKDLYGKEWAAEQNPVLDKESFALLRACREGALVAIATTLY
jgi:hypothetical protein